MGREQRRVWAVCTAGRREGQWQRRSQREASTTPQRWATQPDKASAVQRTSMNRPRQSLVAPLGVLGGRGGSRSHPSTAGSRVHAGVRPCRVFARRVRGRVRVGGSPCEDLVVGAARVELLPARPAADELAGVGSELCIVVVGTLVPLFTPP